MPDQPNKFYVTTPIYYVNARPHIGSAYTTLVADVLARRHRMLGDDVYFLTGTDEHGQKIERSAAAAGVPPQQFVDEVAATFAAAWKRLGITHDQFIRTTSDKHRKGVETLFRTLYDNGFIYLDQYTGAYCVSDEAFVDAPIGSPCPDCGKLLEEVTEENFFFKLSAFQEKLLNLIESNELLITPDTRRNEVLSFIRGNADPSQSSVILSEAQRAESKNPEGAGPAATANTFPATKLGTRYTPGALRDLSISRSSFTWGIPVPADILAHAGAKQKHVVYVWLDALANYITALGYGSDDTSLFEKFWPADLHLMGKEITRFHCVYWPAFLLAAGLPLPKQVTAHGWLLFDNAKMSKSKGNVVRTETILDTFGKLCPPTPDTATSPSREGTTPERPGFNRAVQPATAEGASAPEANRSSSGLQPAESATTPKAALAPEGNRSSSGLQPAEPATAPKGALAPGFRAPTAAEQDLFAADVLRYFLLREIPFGQDGSFTFDAMVTRYNADLANGYGNLVSRVLNMIQQYCDHKIPQHREWRDVRIFVRIDSSGDFVISPDPQLAQDSVICLVAYQRAAARMLFALPKNEDMPTATGVGMLDSATFLISQADSILTKTAPWKLAKSVRPEDQALLRDVLYESAETIRIVTAMLHPIMPYATTRVWQQLGLDPADLTTSHVPLTTWGQLQPGTKLGPLSPIFPRADKGLADQMIDHENHTPTASEPTDPKHPAAPARALDMPSGIPGDLPVAGSSAITTRTEAAPTQATHPAAEPSGIFANTPAVPLDPGPSTLDPVISIDDFAKIDLRIAEIKLAERIPKADKLLRLEVDLGPLGTRQILSGIAEHYTPEELLGRRIIVIANLAPRKMRGLESHGMLLAGSEEGGKPYLATVPEGVPLGTRLK